MLTDAEVEAYSRQKGKNAYYYRHDKEKYPATPKIRIWGQVIIESKRKLCQVMVLCFTLYLC